jgi:small subunit ribosomal protein S16
MYRVVAADSRSPRDGRFLETLGWYRPLDKPAQIGLDIENTIKWLREGAKPSDTVASLFRQTGLAKIWQMAKKGEDYSGETLAAEIKERPHKVKSKARARMKEAADVKEEAAKAAAEKPAEAKAEEAAPAKDAEKPAE